MLHDLRLALRVLVRDRAFAAVAIITLALGISINATMFSLVDAVLLTPPAFAASDRVVGITGEGRGERRFSAVAYPDMLDLRARATSLERVAVHRRTGFTLATKAGAERVAGTLVSSEYFDVFGVRPIVGRTLARGEDQPGAPRVVVLSHAFWRDRFASDPSAVGRTLLLDGEPRTIIGVMPPGFVYPVGTELWTPYVPDKFALDRGMRFVNAVGRLAPTATLDGARQEASAVAAAIANDFTDSSKGWKIRLTPLREMLIGDSRQSLLLVEAAVALVMLIACANVANLLLGRVPRRSREIGVRLALGATRARLVRQLLTESVVLALVGAAIGALLALWQVRALSIVVAPWIPAWAHPAVNARVLLFIIAAATLTGALFGIAPALDGYGAGVRATLAASARTHAGRGGPLQRALVVSELALSLVLLVAAALLVGAFGRLQRQPIGFDADGVLTARVSISDSTFAASPVRLRHFLDEVLRGAAAMPGVSAVGATTELPLAGAITWSSIVIAGRPAPDPAHEPVAAHQSITPDYFRAMRVALLRGRALTDRDDERAPRVAIINETFARTQFPGADPIGARFSVSDSDSLVTIVGVAADIRHMSVTEPPDPTFFVPARQVPTASFVLAVRTSGAPEALAAPLRAVLHGVDASVPLYGVQSLHETLERTLATPKLSSTLIGTFAILSLALATIGLYGVIALGVSQRRRELAVRAALGAQRGDLLRLVVGEGARLTLLGLVIGGAVAAGVARLLASKLPGVTLEVAPLLAAAAALGAVALVATYLPARWASRLEPLEAMRDG